MRNLLGKIALATGSALVAGGLLVIAYFAAVTFILAGFLSAVFLVGERTDVVQYVFAPIAFSALLIFAAASWGLINPLTASQRSARVAFGSAHKRSAAMHTTVMS